MKNYRAKIVVVLLFILLIPSLVEAAGYVRKIIILGNQKTDRQAIINVLGVEKNEFVNSARMKELEGNLINCGLFKKVKIRQRKVSKNRIDIVVRVSEKASLFIFPIFRAWSGRYSGGAVFGESNLFGANKKTLLLGEGGNKLSQFFGVYDDNALFNSDWIMRFRVIVRTDDVPLYSGFERVDEINIKDVGVAIAPGFKWTDKITTRALFDFRYIWHGSSGLVPIITENGVNFSMGFEFIFDSLRRNEALLRGWFMKAMFEFADDRLGSKYNYHKESLEIKYALEFLKYFNWTAALNAKMGRDLPFTEQLTLGGTSLRGYSDRQFRGDGMLSLINELTFPIYSHKYFALRGLAFYDLGFIHLSSEDLKSEDFNSGTGAGLRIYMKKIIMPLLGLDFGYGLDNKNFSVYFSLGLTV